MIQYCYFEQNNKDSCFITWGAVEYNLMFLWEEVQIMGIYC